MKKILALGACALFALTACGPPQDGDNAALAQCLTDKGVKMYGAWWCHNCDNQKTLFGSDFRYIDYTECEPGGDQAPDPEACQDAGIEGYPTWVFPGLGDTPGTPLNLAGTRSLEELARVSGCTDITTTEE